MGPGAAAGRIGWGAPIVFWRLEWRQTGARGRMGSIEGQRREGEGLGWKSQPAGGNRDANATN